MRWIKRVGRQASACCWAGAALLLAGVPAVAQDTPEQITVEGQGGFDSADGRARGWRPAAA